MAAAPHTTFLRSKYVYSTHSPYFMQCIASQSILVPLSGGDFFPFSPSLSHTHVLSSLSSSNAAFCCICISNRLMMPPRVVYTTFSLSLQARHSCTTLSVILIGGRSVWVIPPVPSRGRVRAWCGSHTLSSSYIRTVHRHTRSGLSSPGLLLDDDDDYCLCCCCFSLPLPLIPAIVLPHTRG